MKTLFTPSKQMANSKKTLLFFKIVFKTGFLYCTMLSSSGGKELMHFSQVNIFTNTALCEKPQVKTIYFIATLICLGCVRA